MFLKIITYKGNKNQIFMLKTEAEVWIKPENKSITTDAAKEKDKAVDAKKDRESPSNGSRKRQNAA